jgi:hypothetical protein
MVETPRSKSTTSSVTGTNYSSNWIKHPVKAGNRTEVDYLLNIRMASSKPLRVSGNMRLLSICWMMLMLLLVSA